MKAPRFSVSAYAVVMALAVVAVVANRPATAGAAPCRAADTIIVPERLGYLKNLMSKQDTVYKEPRDSLGFASQNANKVKLVTTAATCQSGVNALNLVLQTPGAVRQIWLFALGNGYAIVDPDIPDVRGQPEPMYFFNSQFQYKGTLMVY